MKTQNVSFFFFSFAALFFSCQKQFLENIPAGAGGGTGSGGATAAGMFASASGVCTPVSIGGTFMQGVPLTSANSITVQVAVTTPGSYTISTNTINGVRFSASGTFTTPGAQNVILAGTGTPLTSGSQAFTLNFGTSSCWFAIHFGGGTAPGPDYFPATVNSFWNYGLEGGTAFDSFLIRVSPVTKTISGNTYTAFLINGIPNTGIPDTLLYRKESGLYYEYFDAETFFGFDAGTANPGKVEYIFLDERAAVNTQWQSAVITGRSANTTYSVYLKMTLTEKVTTPVTSGTAASSDVLKVKYEYYISGGAFATPTILLTEIRWFAKGIGVIYNFFQDTRETEIYKVAGYQVF